MLGMIEILQLSPLIKPVSSFFFKEKKRKARNIKYINSCAQSNLMFKIMNKGLKQTCKTSSCPVTFNIYNNSFPKAVLDS